MRFLWIILLPLRCALIALTWVSVIIGLLFIILGALFGELDDGVGKL